MIPTRFLTTIAHLTAVLLAYYGRSANLLASLPVSEATTDSSQYSHIQSSLVGGVALAVVCLLWELLTLFFGFSLFNNVVNAFHIFCHFVGTVGLCWYLLDTWHYLTFWYLIIFAIAPAVVELIATLRVLCCRIAQY